MSSSSSSYLFDTIAIHAGQANDPLTGAVVTPVYQTTTFAQDELEGSPEYCYSRTGNPTRAALEASLAAIEGGEYGFAFASGLAAANAVLQCLSGGDHVVASQDLYGGCYRLFTKVFSRFGVEFTLVDSTDAAAVAAALRPETKIVWLETPSNPLLRVTDIRACVEVVRRWEREREELRRAKAGEEGGGGGGGGGGKHGLENPWHGVAVLVDNTFATPVFQRPLDLGADIVLHSTTKYIGGHCDVIGGALVTSNPEWYQRLKFIQNATGTVPGPQDCFLLLRGIKTLGLRVERHAQSALRIARFLQSHPAVERVYYPGLRSHPQYELAASQASGFGAIVSAELRGGVEAVRALVPRLRLWPLAESLGGVKSLLCHPATMTHSSVEPAERARIGIGDGLIRLSVGLEDAADLIEDLDQGLSAARPATTAATVTVKQEVSV